MSSPSPAGFFRKTIFLFLLVFGVAVGGVLYLLFRGDGTEAVDLLIPRGSSINAVVDILRREDVMRHPKVFKILLRVTGGSSKVRAGEFRFKKNMRPIDALFVLYRDEPIVHQVTFPEGWTARQYAQILAAAKLGDESKFVKIMLSKESAKRFKLDTPHLEGFLYPDTYAFSRVDGEDRIVEHLVKQFFKKFDKTMQDQAKAMGFTIEQFVTLASVIEKETGVGTERPLVSSVFHNRLRKKMRLQSDPTTIYGIENFNGNLTRKDLQTYSPYNTYKIPGLPLGPICNPGVSALAATLNPAKSDYLYFVANGKGSHVFSPTYEQHARYVNQYQRHGRPLPEQVAQEYEKNSTPKGPPLEKTKGAGANKSASGPRKASVPHRSPAASRHKR